MPWPVTRCYAHCELGFRKRNPVRSDQNPQSWGYHGHLTENLYSITGCGVGRNSGTQPVVASNSHWLRHILLSGGWERRWPRALLLLLVRLLLKKEAGTHKSRKCADLVHSNPYNEQNKYCGRFMLIIYHQIWEWWLVCIFHEAVCVFALFECSWR